MDERHVADYFIVSGVSENTEHNTESKPLINSVLPITDITVIIKGLGEQCPIGYDCIEYTPTGHVADLNNGNFKSPNIHICYRRGNDKPPLIEVGVFYQDKDRILPDVEVVYETPYGNNASTSYSNQKSGTFITYRRAKTNSPYNQLVVVDLCVILNNKSEHPPHAFYSIKKNLNKSYYGMIGSEVFLCYKKTLLSPPSLSFTPQIISRFPLQDLANFPLPDTVPLFCLPAGASVESRPSDVPLPRPVASTFVLTSDSAQKIYGSALSFYEPYDESLLTEDQKMKLRDSDPFRNVGNEEEDTNRVNDRAIYAMKSICILSRWPFFDCFEKFLNFLHKLVFSPLYAASNPSSPVHKSTIPIEHHISHFLLDVSFPTPQRPSVMVQLMPGTDETVTISQPSSRLPLPLTGASFINLLSTLGVENTMNVLLFGLCEQKILLHSLNLWLLTGVAEAISAMLFPFHWQCPYVPLCPLSLHGILNAPLPFIVGIDSRCFDTFTPPEDVICIDLDTRSIFLSEMKKCLNIRILPKRAARVLRNSLDKTFQKWFRISQAIGANQSPNHRSPEIEASKQHLKRKFELEIQEAFVRFMATILRGFRTYLLPITSAPTVGTTDPTSLFNFEGFLMSRDRSYSQFYQLITKTQMFTHYIEERSFVSDKDTSLAFFDDCEEKLSISDDVFSGKPVKLFDKDDGIIQTDRSVYIPAPEQSPSVGQNHALNGDHRQIPLTKRLRFGPLNPALYHRHPSGDHYLSLNQAFRSARLNENSLFNEASKEPINSFSISRRTKQEIKASQRAARKSADAPFEWSKYLVSCCYSLWFSTLPSYITYCKSNTLSAQESTSEETEELAQEKSTARILRYAHSTIVRMQRLHLNTDEVCFRILTMLCGHYGQPALAVRVFFEMKKAGIKPNAVTYGYYNKAVLESRWPDHSSKPTTVMWTKIKNVIEGIAIFKWHGRVRMERRKKRSMHLFGGDMSFGHIDVVDRASSLAIHGSDFFQPTTVPISQEPDIDNDFPYKAINQHRRSLVNRSFSTHQKSITDMDNDTDSDLMIDPLLRHKTAIHKSYSMHLRNGSPERATLLRIKSSSFEDEDESQAVAQKVSNHNETVPPKKYVSAQDMFSTLKERHQLLANLESDQAILNHVHLVDSSAGLLFTTSMESYCRISRSASPSPEDVTKSNVEANVQSDTFLLNPALPSQDHLSNANEFLRTNSYGEDQKILSKIESREQRPNLSDSVDFLQDYQIEPEEVSSNKLSESTTDASNDIDYSSLKNVTSTPNFKLASLINEASNVQWAKWTSSHNSKSVYKGIKSAATGIVSSLQEIKSSFSISNSATPSKLLTTAHHKSTTTREMLSQWATQWGYFSGQTSRLGDEEDSDGESNASNDLLRLSNDEDIEQSSAETNDFRLCYPLLMALENHYKNSSSKDDLIDHLTDSSNFVEDEIAIEIKLTTCSRCNVCHSLLYDEEIMERWSHNESNLNTGCVYCRAKIVPLMTIQVEDYRFSSQVSEPQDTKLGLVEVTNDLVKLSFDDDNDDGINESEKSDQRSSSEQAKPKAGKRHSQANDFSNQNFTVPYLSPIVLRKELESVFECSGDGSPANCRFIDEHPIIFWNLLWYFSRINVPTHLALLCLNAKSILNGRTVPVSMQNRNRVVVRTLWDNEKLHSEVGKPLYRLFERGNPSTNIQAILCDEIHFTRSFLEEVVNLIKTNELQKAMNLVLNARLKTSSKFSFDRNRHNLYRDLIFLINTHLGPDKLYMDNFEREYKRAFESLNFQQVALNRFDRPPTTGSLLCRKSFKEPSLIKRTC